MIGGVKTGLLTDPVPAHTVGSKSQETTLEIWNKNLLGENLEISNVSDVKKFKKNLTNKYLKRIRKFLIFLLTQYY